MRMEHRYVIFVKRFCARSERRETKRSPRASRTARCGRPQWSGRPAALSERLWLVLCPPPPCHRDPANRGEASSPLVPSCSFFSRARARPLSAVARLSGVERESGTFFFEARLYQHAAQKQVSTQPPIRSTVPGNVRCGRGLRALTDLRAPRRRGLHNRPPRRDPSTLNPGRLQVPRRAQR